jgi:uncharacterized OB-fold protein
MERNILGYKCQKCGELHYPNHYRCRKCGHTEWRKMDVVFETYPMPKDGKLLTYTHLYALPPDFEMIKLTLGIVELENGQRITGQLKIEEPKTGMKVKGKVEVVRKDGYNTRHGMVFYAG